MTIKIRKLSSSIGAAVTGVDLAKSISADDQSILKKAWLDNLVLVFPDQEISPEQHISASRIFGPVDSTSAVNAFSHPKHAEIFVLTNEKKNGVPSDTRDIGWQWHSDLTYTVHPSAGAVLHAQAIPTKGGDTMFCNMYQALESLSPKLQQLLESLEAIHDIANGEWFGKRKAEAARVAQSTAVDRFKSSTPPVVQSMVQVHPETGRKSLLIGQTAVANILGFSQAESDMLLDYLTANAIQPQHVYRHHWTKGDLLIWDNRCTMHKVVSDHNSVVEEGALSELRRLHRVTIRGYQSGRLLEPAEQTI